MDKELRKRSLLSTLWPTCPWRMECSALPYFFPLSFRWAEEGCEKWEGIEGEKAAIRNRFANPNPQNLSM